MSTQHDVARVAGVSSATVSRYLADPNQVSPSAAKRVQSAIDELNYKLDSYAQALKTGRSNHIGILTPGTGPFYWQIFFNIQSALAEYNIFSTMMITHDIESKFVNSRDRIFQYIRNKQLEGIIFFPQKLPIDDEIMEQLIKAHEHVVLVDSKKDEKEFHQIYIDNFNAGKNAALEFIKLGHKEFLFIGGARSAYSANERWQGFIEGLAEHGLSIDDTRYIDGGFRSGLTYDETIKNWNNLPHFTAVFANNDDSAMGFIRAAWEKGMFCPKDFSIVGFDNNTEVAPYCKPSLSSFEQSLHIIGKKAATTLVDLMRNGGNPPKQQVITPYLVARESLAPPPI